MWRVIRIAGWVLAILVFLAVAREGWTQLLLAALAIPFVVFVWGFLGFGGDGDI